MTLQLALTPTMMLTVLVLAVLLLLAMPAPRGFVGSVRAILGRPILSVIAAIGLYAMITLAGALMSLPAATAAPTKAPNHRGAPIGDWGGRL